MIGDFYAQDSDSLSARPVDEPAERLARTVLKALFHLLPALFDWAIAEGVPILRRIT
jgi:hypothetical protein